MNPTILEKTKDRYRIASKALARMEAESTLEGREDEWFTFLRAWKGIYTTLEQAVKGDSKATMWFGQQNAARRKDQLLQYMYQARNDDEHGLTRTTAREPGHISFGRAIDPSRSVHIGRLEFRSHGEQLTIIDGGGHSNFDPYVEVVPEHLKLMPVKDRDRSTTYNPPSQHLGQPFDDGTDPVIVAQAALKYAENLLRDAENF